MQLWDPNGDTYGYVGSRTTGREAGHYALTGPGWTKTLPESVKRIDAPYNTFVIWGRIGVSGADDVKNALAFRINCAVNAAQPVRTIRSAGGTGSGLFRDAGDPSEFPASQKRRIARHFYSTRRAEIGSTESQLAAGAQRGLLFEPEALCAG